MGPLAALTSPPPAPWGVVQGHSSRSGWGVGGVDGQADGHLGLGTQTWKPSPAASGGLARPPSDIEGPGPRGMRGPGQGLPVLGCRGQTLVRSQLWW